MWNLKVHCYVKPLFCFLFLNNNEKKLTLTKISFKVLSSPKGSALDVKLANSPLITKISVTMTQLVKTKIVELCVCLEL